MQNQQMSIPVSALQFKNAGSRVGGSLDMIGYSGGVIPSHWFWNNLSIDLKGIELSKQKFPILEDHRTDRKVGFFTRDQVHVNGGLKVSGGTVLDTLAGIEFAKLSKEGYPWQASLHATPTSIQRLEEGEKAKVNGFTLEGPGTVWKRCVLKEISVCTIPFDPNTSAQALTANPQTLSVMINGEFDPQELADEQMAEYLFNLSNGHVEPKNLELSADDADDEKLAEAIFRASTGSGR